MLCVEVGKLKKQYGDHFLIESEQLKIFTEDKIGIVGANGAGKTTLLNILSGRLQPDEGSVKLFGTSSYVSQLEEPEIKRISLETASLFGTPAAWNEHMSGGEKSKFKMAVALEQEADILFADEPTSNVDIHGRELMEQKLLQYKGALVIISHDRSFLDRLCKTIWEIDQGQIKQYPGNYSVYRKLKDEEAARKLFEYEEYIKEKKRLETVCQEIQSKSQGIKRAPKRMGNSEARLHKMGGQRAKANLDRALKNVEKRLEHMTIKERPQKERSILLDLNDTKDIFSKVLIKGEGISKEFGQKEIFREASFTIYNSSKVALLGPNGCGKSTLIKMIINREGNIQTAPGAKLGYFSQDMDILDHERTVLENVMQDCIYSQSYARRLLARLLLDHDDITKKVAMLSGGERVKLSLAKILLQDINLLILDEPTNYLDIKALEALENALDDFAGSLLFVSHDRSLIHRVANQIMTIENQKIITHHGTYQDYLDRQKRTENIEKRQLEEQLVILQNRLTDVVSRLSLPAKKDDVAALDKAYREITGQLKALKARLSQYE